MDTDPVNSIYKSQQSTKKDFVKNLKDILDQAKQSIYVNK